MVFNNIMDNLPVAVAYAALRAQIRREFEEHVERDNRPVTVMTIAGLVTLSFTGMQGNDA
ncbi:hypothetical protein D6D04_09337 [Aureobasidium pullulans]|nr:hypothetical protein D6D04_09337 [Aureobasidium pullulans]